MDRYSFLQEASFNKSIAKLGARGIQKLRGNGHILNTLGGAGIGGVIGGVSNGIQGKSFADGAMTGAGIGAGIGAGASLASKTRMARAAQHGLSSVAKGGKYKAGYKKTMNRFDLLDNKDKLAKWKEGLGKKAKKATEAKKAKDSKDIVDKSAKRAADKVRGNKKNPEEVLFGDPQLMDKKRAALEAEAAADRARKEANRARERGRKGRK